MKHRLDKILEAARAELINGNSILCDKHLVKYWESRRLGIKPPIDGDDEARWIALENKKNCRSCGH